MKIHQTMWEEWKILLTHYLAHNTLHEHSAGCIGHNLAQHFEKIGSTVFVKMSKKDVFSW